MARNLKLPEAYIKAIQLEAAALLDWKKTRSWRARNFELQYQKEDLAMGPDGYEYTKNNPIYDSFPHAIATANPHPTSISVSFPFSTGFNRSKGRVTRKKSKIVQAWVRKISTDQRRVY